MDRLHVSSRKEDWVFQHSKIPGIYYVEQGNGVVEYLCDPEPKCESPQYNFRKKNNNKKKLSSNHFCNNILDKGVTFFVFLYSKLLLQANFLL